MTGRLVPEFDAAPWKNQAACADADPDLFFPVRGDDTGPAKRICYRCPVKDECLKHALIHMERYGIWGETSERERRKIRVKIRRRMGLAYNYPLANVLTNVMVNDLRDEVRRSRWSSSAAS